MIVNGKLVSKENSGKCTLNTCFKISRKLSYSWKCFFKKCFHRNDAGSLKLTVLIYVGRIKGYCSALFCIWPFSKSWKEEKIFLSFKKKVTHLNNTCFWLWSIKKKGKHRMYNIKINVGKYNAWYMKINRCIG